MINDEWASVAPGWHIHSVPQCLLVSRCFKVVRIGHVGHDHEDSEPGKRVDPPTVWANSLYFKKRAASAEEQKIDVTKLHLNVIFILIPH